MPDRELLATAKQFVQQASEHAEEYSGTLSTVRDLIVEHFGENGLLAAYIVGGVLLVLLISRLAKISLATVKYLVIPSLALAILATLVLNFSFAVSLPVTVTLCSLVLLFKG